MLPQLVGENAVIPKQFPLSASTRCFYAYQRHPRNSGPALVSQALRHLCAPGGSSLEFLRAARIHLTQREEGTLPLLLHEPHLGVSGLHVVGLIAETCGERAVHESLSLLM